MKKKTVIIIGVLVVIVGMIGLGLKFGNQTDTSMVYVVSGVAKTSDVTAFVNTSGTVSAKSSYDIYPKLTGEIIEVMAWEGDHVTKGQVLCQLDPTSLENQIRESEIQLEIAKESLLQIVNKGSNNYKGTYKNAVLAKDNAYQAYLDAKKLYEAGVGTKASMDGAYNSYKQAANSYEEARSNYNNENSDSEIKIQELRIQSLENGLADLRKKLEDTQITSPIDGVITFEKAKLLSAVSPSMAVFTVEDLDHLIVKINVSQYDIHKLSVGQKTTIKANGLDDESFEGTVSKIGTKALAKNIGASQEMVIEVEIDVTSKKTPLKPNYSVKTEVETARVEDALVLPYEAVYVNKDDEMVVFTVHGSTVKQHVIERGVEGVFNFQAITESIQAGDHVILNPTEAITEDIQVVETEVKE